MILPASYSNGFAPRDGQPLYPELWRGCVGAWAPCLGPSGLTLRDWSGRGNHGAMTNMDAAGDWVPSGGRYALDFDGTNDRIAYAYSAAHETTSGAGWSVGGWANPRSVTAGTHTLINRNRAGSSARDYILYTGDAARWSIQNSDTVNFPTLNAGVATANVWQHVFATCSVSGAAVLYVNGISVGTTTLRTNITSSPQLLNVGATVEAVTQYFFNGQLDDIRVYNRPLSGNEVRLLATRRGIAYELAPRRRSRVSVITSGFSALRPSILRGAR